MAGLFPILVPLSHKAGYPKQEEIDQMKERV